MTIRARVVGLGVICAALAGVMIAIAFFGLDAAGRMVDRMEASHRRLELIAQIETNANAYVEKVAAVLLMGRDELDALGAARIRLERAFAALTQATRDEIATQSDMAAIQNDLPKIDDVQKMLALYHAIDMSTNRALELQRQGQMPSAIATFQRQVEFRILNELQPLLEHNFDTESAEGAELSARVGTLHTSLTAGAAGAAVLGLGALAVAGAALFGNLGGRLAALAATIAGLRRGALEMRAPEKGRDEIAALGRDLNAMAEALGEERAALRDRLERQARELEMRTGQLAEARQRLREIETRQAEFLAGIGHELRTPLTVLRGEADVALRAPPDPADQRASLERISGQAAELAQLLDQLVAYARTDIGAQPVSRAEFPLAELVRAAAEEAEILAGPREVEIVLALADEGLHVEGDFRRLKQVLMIGLDNAVKHSAPGSRIHLAAARAGEEAVLTIRDEGPGVAQEDQPHVFERFYRGRGEEDRLTEGLGIGLAIAKEIVERHSGRISLDNAPAGGAVLTIALPLAGTGAA